MTLIRALVCSVGLVMALAPTMGAFADSDSDHLQAELANAAAQYQLALDQAAVAQHEGELSQENERMIAFLQSEAMRQKQLDVTANGNAIESIAATLANAARSQGDVNARNELLILQNKAAILVAHADATVANANAQGRPDEIANANAQSKFLHSLADTITSVLAETNMSNAKIIAENNADDMHSHGLVEQANGRSLAAGALFAADQSLMAGQLAAVSTASTNNGKASLIIAKASASLRNAQAMAAGS
jgi:hypothetical protein